MNKNIAVIRGDGIGPEIVNQALKVLDKVAQLYGHTFTYTDVDMGGCAIDKYGDIMLCANEDNDIVQTANKNILLRREGNV